MVAVVKIKYTNQITLNTRKIDLNVGEIAYFMIISGFYDLDLQIDN